MIFTPGQVVKFVYNGVQRKVTVDKVEKRGGKSYLCGNDEYVYDVDDGNNYRRFLVSKMTAVEILKKNSTEVKSVEIPSYVQVLHDCVCSIQDALSTISDSLTNLEIALDEYLEEYDD